MRAPPRRSKMALADVLRLPAASEAAFVPLGAPRDLPGPPPELAVRPCGAADPPGPGLRLLHGTTTLAFKVRPATAAFHLTSGAGRRFGRPAGAAGGGGSPKTATVGRLDPHKMVLGPHNPTVGPHKVTLGPHKLPLGPHKVTLEPISSL